MMMPELLKTVWVGNQLWQIIAFACIWVFAALSSFIVRALMRRLSAQFEAKDKATRAALFEAFGKTAIPVFALIGLHLGISSLSLSPAIEPMVGTIIEVLYIIAVGWVIFQCIRVPMVYLSRRANRTASKLDDMLVPIAVNTLRILVVFLVMVQLAQTLSDKPMTSIIASLGIGGLAIALAARESIQNFFGSIMIFSDRPFELDDRIIVDNIEGSVRAVGLRSTKLETPDGDWVTIPNGVLANKTITNTSQRPFVYKTDSLSIRHDKSWDKIDLALTVVKEILEGHEGMDPSRKPKVYMETLKADRAVISIALWYHPCDELKYKAWYEQFNRTLLERFEAHAIEII